MKAESRYRANLVRFNDIISENKQPGSIDICQVTGTKYISNVVPNNDGAQTMLGNMSNGYKGLYFNMKIA